MGRHTDGRGRAAHALIARLAVGDVAGGRVLDADVLVAVAAVTVDVLGDGDDQVGVGVGVPAGTEANLVPGTLRADEDQPRVRGMTVLWNLPGQSGYRASRGWRYRWSQRASQKLRRWPRQGRWRGRRSGSFCRDGKAVGRA